MIGDRPFAGRSRGRRATLGLGVLVAMLCLLGLSASSAFAERPFDSALAEQFEGLSSFALDSHGDLWITDEGHETPAHNPGSNSLYEHNPFPSQTLLDTPNTTAVVHGIVIVAVAVDQSTGDVLLANSNPRAIDFFEEKGPNNQVYSHNWFAINGARFDSFNTNQTIHAAVDNSNLLSRGRIYLSLTAPEDDIEMFDPGERPIDFPATAKYIHNNKLTGTPSGRFGSVGEIEVDSSGNLYVVDGGKGVVDEFDPSGIFLRSFPNAGPVAIDPTDANVLIGNQEFDSSGNLLEELPIGGPMVINSQGYLYAGTRIYKPNTVVATVTYQPVSAPTPTGGTLNASVSPNGGGDIAECKFEYGTEQGNYSLGSKPCEATSGLPYGSATEVSAKLTGLSTETTYHYRVALATSGGAKYGTDQTYTPGHVAGLRTEVATNLSESGATLNGTFVGGGEEIHYHFEWGPTEAYGNTTPVSATSHSGAEAVAATLTEGLTPYSTYHYRLVASNGAGTSDGEDRIFTTSPGVPTAQDPSTAAVHSDRALLEAQLNPNGADTTVEFEYVDDADFQASGWANAGVAPAPGIGIGRGKHYQSVSTLLKGLTPNTLYHYRAVGSNEAGSGNTGATFKTFPFTPSLNDPCPNAHVRQQTGAALLLDCRGYELVSAANAGGYDVESSLVEGQMPFADYPEAESPPEGAEVLYGVHDGGIPATGHPTNLGVDPYVATRGPNGWTTKYVGIPANDVNASGPFASTLDEADAGLDTLAFAGPEICSPCFSDHSTGVPIHLPSGELVQGMSGSIPQPSAKPAGFIAKALAADGSHFVFGSTSKFEPEANEGELAIYDRNLKTDQTALISKGPGGEDLPCLIQCSSNGLGELGVSKDGSRIVVGQLVSENGNAKYWHLYMNIGDSKRTVELTPGASDGALFDGMSADGSKVFFTSTDALSTATNQDTDHSADIYEAEVSESGAVTITRVSTGSEGTGNSDSCDPSSNTAHVHWNTTGSEENCGVVAIGGGGGVASGDGTIYFLSPEKLDGSSNGVENAPNLYIVRPGGAPHFVTTLESSSNAPLPPLTHPFLRSFGSFERPSGVAIDHSTGDVYVLDITGESSGSGFVQKFDSSGRPVTSFGEHGVLIVPGMEGNEGLPTQLAVDESTGNLYLPAFTRGVVIEYDSSGSRVAVIEAGSPSGVAVDQANGDLYVSDYLESGISVFDNTGEPVRNYPSITEPTGVAVSTTGTAYVVSGGGESGARGTTEIYGPTGTDLGVLDENPSFGVAVDPSDNHVYVDEGNQVSEFDSAGNPFGAVIGAGLLTESISLAADSGVLAISNPGGGADVDLYGPAVVPSGPSTDNPAVIDSVSSPGTRHTADFQLTPSGEFAAFPSALPLTGYDNAAHREIFRYGAGSEEIVCASCTPTAERATGEARLPSNGLGLSNDGRVFFNSTEGLVDRDLNEKEDAYQWEPQGFEFGHGSPPCETSGGCVQLISTGAGPLNSSLLGITVDGTDAYFFTHQKLAEQDENGGSVKIYDARELGGFPFSPAEIQCKASDECHGAGSQPPPPTVIKTIAGAPVGNAVATKCKSGFIAKGGRCVRKAHKQKRHHKRNQHRGARRHG